MISFALGYALAILWHRDKKFAYCGKCGARIRVNKPFFGSLHQCDPSR